MEPEIIVVENDTDGVACDGGNGALGHPKVWYGLQKKSFAECGYCNRLFVKKSAETALRKKLRA